VTFVVVYDACVLYPSLLRDVLIRVAQEGLVQAKWTDAILDEVFRNLRADRPDLDPAKLSRTRQLMTASVRDSLVKGHEPLVGDRATGSERPARGRRGDPCSRSPHRDLKPH
jgi:hypothetical protein